MDGLTSSLPMRDLRTTGIDPHSTVLQGCWLTSCNERHLNDLEISHWDRAIAVMTTSCFLALKHGSAAMMVTSPEKPKEGGSIVMTSSCAAFLGAFADVAYSKCFYL